MWVSKPTFGFWKPTFGFWNPHLRFYKTRFWLFKLEPKPGFMKCKCAFQNINVGFETQMWVLKHKCGFCTISKKLAWIWKCKFVRWNSKCACSNSKCGNPHVGFETHIWVLSQNPHLGFETHIYFLKCTFALCMENQILVFVSKRKYGFQNPNVGFKR